MLAVLSKFPLHSAVLDDDLSMAPDQGKPGVCPAPVLELEAAVLQAAHPSARFHLELHAQQ